MKKNLHYLYLLALLFSFSAKINAQTTDWLWAKSACALSAATNITAVTTDAAGNIFIAGNFRDSALFGSTVFHPVGTANMFVAKYDSLGNYLWMLQGSGNNVPPYNLVTDICTDSSGNCYFTGYFNGNIIMSHDTITSAGSMPDVFAGKITGNGTIAWLQQGSGPGSDYAYGIGLDADGNCYVGGSFDQQISFGSIQLSANNSSNDIFILKLDVSGNFSSAHAAGGSAVDLVSSMTVDKNGNCFLTGTFTSPELILGTDTLHYASTGADAYFAKFDSAATPLWGRAGYGPGSQEPSSIATDPNGNCYVTGVFKGDTMFVDTVTLLTHGYWDFFTLKYNSSGSLLWAGHLGSSSFGSEFCTGIVADSAENFYTTGLFRDPATFDTITVTSLTNNDIFVTKFNSTGSAAWVEQSGSGSGGLIASSIHMDELGNIFIAGSYETSTIIGNDSLVVLPGYTAGYYFAKIGAIDTTSTGIRSNHGGKHFSVYPNPASTELWIGNAGTENVDVRIYDMMGNLIYKSAITNKSIDISYLPSGLYFVELRSELVTQNQLFIKE